ncbi:NADP-dependent oxidoreductase [Streptosporangium sp. NPDC051022]|uniref:NADP-dependent oxidoreductase n=1 Tax=Streptosporangium sp. NPDC051022 TaxID=3155752 RepID=UPI00342659E8
MPVAIAFSEYGGPEVLHQITVEEPEAGPGQVRVRVRAAGVAPFDTKLRAGELAGFFNAAFPQRLGNEFAGVVDEVGPEVTGFAAGDEVIGFTFAEAYAEVVVVPAGQLAGKPEGLPWEVAGALPVVGQGAYHFVQELNVESGETFLIHAAAGGVGTVAAQLARLRGAKVIGTAGEGNHDYLRSLGVIPVTYGEGLVDRIREVAPDGVDAALDAIGGVATDVSVKLVADRDRIGTLVDADQAIEKYGIRRLVGGRSPETLAHLADLAVRGELRLPTTAFALADVAQAHRRVDGGHGRGKVVLTVG